MRGLYEKYKVFERCKSCLGTGICRVTHFGTCLDCKDGWTPVPSDQKLFVLNLTKDEVAREAVKLYATLTDNTELAWDINNLLRKIENEKA